MELSLLIAAGYAAGLLAPLFCRLMPRHSGKLLSLVPAALTGWLLTQWPLLSDGHTLLQVQEWVPSVSLVLSFRLNGLAFLLALLICGIGSVIVLYADGYLAKDHPQRGRFFLYLLCFMASMLGVVLSDNLICLFVFWELTSLTSFLLIGFEHRRAAARRAAQQALLVTCGGGLALLAGFVLLGTITSSYALSEITQQAGLIQSHPLYGPILGLILIGAFTKSAQFPFHFWLPNAMEAPTPVSAYLHSATMVKAGVFLLCVFYPILGGTRAWFYALAIPGSITMLLGAWLAIRNTDLKRILAYTTLSILGMLVLLLSLHQTVALEAAIVLLLAHSLYKGALFMLAGGIDHATGTRDVRQLGGLAQPMPITAALAVIAGLSMAGVPPLFGFIAKESIYGSTLATPHGSTLVTGSVLLASAAMFCAALSVCFQPFFGARNPSRLATHENDWKLWAGPLLLSALGAILGLFPGLVDRSLLGNAVDSITSTQVPLQLQLFHGWNFPLLLSLVTLISGLFLFRIRAQLQAWPLQRPADQVWDGLLNALIAGSSRITAILQSGLLSHYLRILFLTTILLLGVLSIGSIPRISTANLAPVSLLDSVFAVLTILAALTAVLTRNRMTSIIALGVVGLCIALLFLFYGATDLALTQVLVETLTVLLFVFVFRTLPAFKQLSTPGRRIRDACIGGAFGGLITLIIIISVNVQQPASISAYHVANSYSLAHGKNIVNVILVDFRAIDTLGEISVLAIAALGVVALLKISGSAGKKRTHR